MAKHVQVNALTATHAATPPASNVTETATSTAMYRIVFGTINLTAGAVNAASITFDVETGVGTGSYTTVLNPRVAGGLTTPIRTNFSFPVPAGRRYRWVAGGLAGVTETIQHWNYQDIG